MNAFAQYAEVAVTTNYSFLRGASHPRELVETAAKHGYVASNFDGTGTFGGVIDEVRILDHPLAPVDILHDATFGVPYSAAVSTDTRSMPAGWCLTSKKCFTIMRS